MLFLISQPLSRCSSAALKLMGQATGTARACFSNLSPACTLEICTKLLVRKVMERWTGKEKSLNKGERKTVITSGGKFPSGRKEGDLCALCLFTICIFKGLGIDSTCLTESRPSECGWTSPIWEETLSSEKNLFIQSFDLKISIQSTTLNVCQSMKKCGEKILLRKLGLRDGKSQRDMRKPKWVLLVLIKFLDYV